NRFADEATPRRRSGRPAPANTTCSSCQGGRGGKVRTGGRQATKSGYDTTPATPLSRLCPTATSDAASGNGASWRSTARRTVKMAVLAPMPSAMVASATIAKPGRATKPRRARRTSWMIAMPMGRATPLPTTQPGEITVEPRPQALACGTRRLASGQETRRKPGARSGWRVRLLIQHRSHYGYGSPAVLGSHTLRVRPAPHTRARVEAYRLHVEPDHILRWQQDPSGNHVARVDFPPDRPTTALDILVELTVDVHPVNPFDFLLDDEAEEVPFAYAPSLRSELAPFL